MTSETIYEVAEATAPTFERRRAEVEELSAQIRERMLRELAPGEGDTVLELAAGVRDTGITTGSTEHRPYDVTRRRS
jgi:hypothetical protein